MGSEESGERLASEHDWPGTPSREDGWRVSEAERREFLAAQSAMAGKIITAFTSAGFFSGGAGGSSVNMIFDADSGRWEAPPSVHVNTIHHWGSAGGGGGAYPAQPVTSQPVVRAPEPHVPTYAEARLKWTETGDVTWLEAMESAWSPVAEQLWDDREAKPALIQRGDWTAAKAYGLALLAGVVFWTGILALILW